MKTHALITILCVAAFSGPVQASHSAMEKSSAVHCGTHHHHKNHKYMFARRNNHENYNPTIVILDQYLVVVSERLLFGGRG